MKLNLTYLSLVIIFIFALAIRFIYFPDNTYVSYDAARDALTSINLLNGDIKIVGPYSSFNNFLHHGPLVYYMWAPILLMFNNAPEALSAFTRLYNALILFVIFLVAKELFNNKVGLIAAILFAFSYEQTQYALFLGHPTYAVLPVTLFYLGLIHLFFKKNPWGAVLSALSFGLSMQFHYAQVYLFITFLLLMAIFRKNIPKFSLKQISLTILALLASLSTFIIAEIKYGFPAITEIFNKNGVSGAAKFHLEEGLYVYYRFVKDNFIFDQYSTIAMIALFIGMSLFFIFRSQYKKQVVFLLIWVLTGGIIYFLTGSSAYYYSAGSSLGLLILGALIIYIIFSKNNVLGGTLLIIILSFNTIHITKENVNGPNNHVIIQQDMIYRNQKMAIDYMYQTADGQPFAVNGITIPLYVNTTWSYLFESIGYPRYGYLPIWGGKAALGYPGNLEVIEARTSLPNTRFLIIEPQMGISDSITQDIIREENYFSKVTEEKKFGLIIVQKREPIR